MIPHDLSRHEQYTQLWTAAIPAISGFIHSIVYDSNLADDIIQEVALITIRKFPEFDQSKSFRGWAFGIAKNVIKKSLSAQRKQAKHLSDNVIEQLCQTAESHEPQLQHTRQALRECIKSIPDQSRKALHLRYSEQLDYERISKKLKTTVLAARKTLSRIHAKLRKCVTLRLQKSQL